MLYTDGLVERRDVPLDTGLQRLLDAAVQAPAGAVDVLADHVLAEMADDGFDDDVALLLAALAD